MDMRLWMTRFQRRVLLGMAAVVATAVIIDCGDTNTPPEKSNGITQVTVTPAATGLDTPLDVTPDPMGVAIYYIAAGEGGFGVFRVPFAGGTPTQVYVGAPFAKPRSISISSDGQTLYVADPAGGTDGKGVIWTLPSSGDTPVPLSGTAGLKPAALEVYDDGPTDTVYFAGSNANDEPAIFSLSAKGGMPDTLAAGLPLVQPDGIAVATDGHVYIADAEAGTKQPGQAFKLVEGKPTKVGPEFTPGSPTGIAVTLDDAKLLVSSLDAASGTSQVTIVQTADGSASVFNDVIKQNNVSGGVHRARFKEAYAWAGYNKVYGIRIKTILADSSTPGGVGG
ncbi:MAG: hypothetical protein QM820_28445 [Minicystis sp.]